METALPVGQRPECGGNSPADAGPWVRSWGKEMSEMTIIQLVVAQRERELRAQRQAGWEGWSELPCTCVIGACLLLLGIMAATAAVVFAPFRPPATPQPDRDTGQG